MSNQGHRHFSWMVTVPYITIIEILIQTLIVYQLFCYVAILTCELGVPVSVLSYCKLTDE